MNAQEFIADYEAELPPLSEPTKELRAWMLLGSGWSDGDGPTPGVWANGKERGHRCLWSCRWSTSHGVVTPNQVWPLEQMTFAELLGEALDLAYSRTQDPIVAGKVIPAVLDYYGSGNVTGITRLLPALHQLRGGYGEYVWQPSPPSLNGPGNLMYLSLRPGWWVKADFFAVPTVSLNA